MVIIRVDLTPLWERLKASYSVDGYLFINGGSLLTQRPGKAFKFLTSVLNTLKVFIVLEYVLADHASNFASRESICI